MKYSRFSRNSSLRDGPRTDTNTDDHTFHEYGKSNVRFKVSKVKKFEDIQNDSQSPKITLKFDSRSKSISKLDSTGIKINKMLDTPTNHIKNASYFEEIGLPNPNERKQNAVTMVQNRINSQKMNLSKLKMMAKIKEAGFLESSQRQMFKLKPKFKK